MDSTRIDGLTKLLIEAARERSLKIRLLFGRDGSLAAEIEKLRTNLGVGDIQPLQTTLQAMLLVIVADKAQSTISHHRIKGSCRTRFV